MADLRLPVLRFPSGADRDRALPVLEDQRFDARVESGTELSLTPWSDLDDARDLLLSEGIACEVAETAVRRLGPARPAPSR